MAEEHLGIGYLGAVLKREGVGVEIIDGYLGRLDCDEIKEKIEETRPKIIGFSVYQDSLESFIEIAKFVRNDFPAIHICLGGYLATFNYASLFSLYGSLIDSVVLGEGEFVFLNIAKNIIAKKYWKNIRGIIFKNKSSLIKNPPQQKIADLDTLPFPLRLTIKKTMAMRNPVHVCASRGCYGNCSFCSINAFNKVSSGEIWRGRSIKNIVDEIEFLKGKYGPAHFKFVDDCWFPPRGWKERALEFCRELDKRKLKISFRLSCRSDNVDHRVFRELKRRGLFSVSLGVESAVSRQLKDWRKGVNARGNIRALGVCKKLDIIVQMGYIMFDRDTTIEELKIHLDFLQKMKFAVTKSIYSCLFAAEGTDVAREYKKHINTRAKNSDLRINVPYSFRNKNIGKIAKALKLWAEAYGGIYAMAIDPLSAPRAISLTDRKKIWKIMTALKDRDLDVFRELINMAETGRTKLLIDYVKDQVGAHKLFMEKIKARLADFYKKRKMIFEIRENIYIK